MVRHVVVFFFSCEKNPHVQWNHLRNVEPPKTTTMAMQTKNPTTSRRKVEVKTSLQRGQKCDTNAPTKTKTTAREKRENVSSSA